ncbi:MAG: YbdK family carboxylate-amine ligase [Solirubrobacterales bacterium]|nr:YbdK family carboxylate-amine ligase [Solirubrobacterales bacterium]
MTQPVLDAPAFGSTDAFTLGVEQELFLVDAVGRQRNAGGHVLEALPEFARGQVSAEVHACQVELISGVCRSAEEAIADLRALRDAVLGVGVGLLGTGIHPTAREGEAEITDKERYNFISALLGDALVDPVGALHVHVGMPDAETAIRAFNGLRPHLPLLEALAANSPFRHGRDTGLASAREITLRAWPRSGTPRAFGDWADFRSMAEGLTRVAEVPDYTFHWWKLRPHPQLGTVELRALDAQASLAHTEALVKLAHALARYAAVSPPDWSPAPEILEEASFRACREGLDARLPDREAALRPARDLLDDLLDRVQPDEDPCLRALLVEGGGAGVQRASASQDGNLDEVLAELRRRAQT